MDNYDGSDGLQSLKDNGRAPASRMESASGASERIGVLINSEKRGRSQRRAMVKGLVDGNPPYRAGDMKANGKSGNCNVNWRVAEFYLNMGRYALYEVFAETPTFATVETDFGDAAARRDWSGIITEEFDWLLRTDPSWDRVNQFSIYDMVLYGCGPLIFNDEMDWRNEFVHCANLIVPDFASSDPMKWEEAAILRNYLPSELYQCIRNADAAKERGWNLEVTRKAIMKAHTLWGNGGQYQQWEWHQQQLKNNSFHHQSQSKSIQTAHYYFREFPEPGQAEGHITHCIVINPEDNQVDEGDYLFRHVGRYESWNQIVHPMYYDNDGGGYHHSVTGLGQKMYSAMEYQNRLLCNLADKTFAPKVLFKPLTAQSSESFNIVQFADFGKIPANFDVVQMPVGSYTQEGIEFNRELTSLMSSNLSQYKTALSSEGGNPITAYEAGLRASQQSQLAKTQLTHNYNQRDWLLEEKYKRAVNPKLNGFMPGGREAVQFRNACLARGVPMQALRRYLFVRSTRTVGQGSQFMRVQALQQILAVASMLPSDGGRQNVVSDYVAAVAGQSMVDRYSPKEQSPQAIDQLTIATLQIGAAKDGVAPTVGGSQNHYIFARAFLSSMVQAIQSVKQAQDPQSLMQMAPAVLQFLDTLGPACAQHIQALANDPSRQKDYKIMLDQLKQVEAQKNDLKSQVQKFYQQMAKQQQRTAKRQQQVMTDAQIDQYESQNKLRMQQEKTDAMIRLKEQKQAQSLQLADASTASSISLKSQQVEADTAMKARKSESTAAE